MGCNTSKFIDIERDIGNIAEEFDKFEQRINNLEDVNTKLIKEVDHLNDLNTIDTTVYQCWTGTVSGILPEESKTCSIKLTIIDLIYKTKNENIQWIKNSVLEDKILERHINDLYNYNYHYTYREKHLGASEELTSNPFIMNNTYNSYSSSYNVSLEITYDTNTHYNTHYKYLTRIITWLVEKNGWGNIGSNKKKDFVWTKSFVNV